jgi:hypothetical protein
MNRRVCAANTRESFRVYGFHRAGFLLCRLCVWLAMDRGLPRVRCSCRGAAPRGAMLTGAPVSGQARSLTHRDFVQMSDGLPTPHSISRTSYLVHVRCNVCRHAKATDLAALVDAGAGDMPWVQMKWRCDNCGSRLTEFILGGSHMRPR